METPLEDSQGTAVSHDSDNEEHVTSAQVILRIEQLAKNILEMLDEDTLPVMESYPSNNGNPARSCAFIRWNQCRSFTNICLVLAYCHALLQTERTTTIREVYYFYVTHFRSQRECDAAIWNAAALLQVERHDIGLVASPKGVSRFLLCR
jgi:DNA topoisomerase VI subunit A